MAHNDRSPGARARVRETGAFARRALCLVLAATAAAATAAAAQAAEPGVIPDFANAPSPTLAPGEGAPLSAPTLNLANGDSIVGRLAASPTAGEVVWDCPRFAKPLVFPMNVVSSVRFPPPAQPAATQAEFRFELAGGDIVLGALEAWDDQQIVVDAPQLGRLRIEPAALRRVIRSAGDELLFAGPNGLAGWQTFGPEDGWREDAGHLVARQEGAGLRRDFGLPAQACFEIELSWDKTVWGKTADFELSLGPVGLEAAARPFRLEVVGHSAVLVRETSQRADVAKLQELPADGGGRLHWLLFVDQERGRMLVQSADGKALADLTVPQDSGRELIELVVGRETTIKHDAKIAEVEVLRNADVFDAKANGKQLKILAKKAGLSQLKFRDERGRWHTSNVIVCDRAGLPGPGGLQLISNNGNLRLERLAISRWNGEPPPPLDASKAHAQTGDGAILAGRVRSYDAAARQFVVETESGERRLDAARAVDIRLPAPEAKRPVPPLTAVCAAGHRVSGELLKVEQDAAWLKCPQLRDPLAVKIDDLVAILAAESSGKGPDLAGRMGRLELDGVSLHGWLADGRDADGGALVWQPNLSPSGSPLQAGVAGRIVYRDPPPPGQTAAPAAEEQPFGAVQQALRTLFPESGAATPVAVPVGDALLHLRSGDSFSATIVGIDERGATFQSKSTDATFVPHEHLQAVELRVATAPVKIVKPKKDRLLTLPRMQRDNPPTHLVRGVNGDYLRGRLVSLDDKELRLEIRLETRVLPREAVARVIWLHPEAAEKAAAAPADSAAVGGANLPAAANATERLRAPLDDDDDDDDGGGGAGVRVQTIPRMAAEHLRAPLGGAANRLTFIADRFENPLLSGASALLGPCRVDVHAVDQILIGAAIDRAASSLAFHQWTLKAAAEPRGAESGPGGEGGEGLESALVGKPAPEMELNLVDGGKFHVADYRQKVLVLDFWASWCGPCLQAMPQVEKVAREFANQDVRLVGINLQEDADRVRATLERLQLEMQVALDRDGRMAERYGAVAIPQTVIVDRDGKVARLFVGGGARFDEQLREALRGVLAPPAKAE